MTTAVLTPNATSSGAAGSLTGGATAHEVLAAISDASYATWTTAGLVELALTDSAMPSTARVKWVRAVARRRTTNATNQLRLVGILGTERRTLLDLTTVAASFAQSAGGYTTGLAVPDTAGDVAAYALEVQGLNVDASYAVVEVVYVEQPVVSVDAVDPDPFTGSAPTISWGTTLDADGGSQTRYRIRTFTAAQYGADGFDPATSDAYADTGTVLGANTSAAVGPLENGTYRSYVTVAQDVNGAFWSDPDFDEYTITGDTAEVAAVTVIADDAAARHRVTVNRDTGEEAWDQVDVERSTDAGATWTAVRSATYAAATGDVFTVDDYEVGNDIEVLYRARGIRDGSSGPIYGAWTIAEEASVWRSTASWLKVVDDPSLNIIITEDDPYTDQARNVPAGVYRILGNAFPVVISDVMGATTSTLRVLTDTRAGIRTLLDTLERITLLYHPAPGMNIGDAVENAAYIAVLGVTEAWRAEGNPDLRVWSINYTEVEAPVGAVTFNPSAPTDVQLVPTNTIGELTLTWSAPAFGVAVSYEVEVDESDGTAGTWVDAGSDTAPVTYAWDPNSTGERQMRVRSVGENGSNSVWAVATATPEWTPSIPTSVTISDTATIGELTLEWSAPTIGPPDVYEVEVDESDGTAGTWVGSADDVSPSSYTWDNLTGSRQMRVRAVGENGTTSAWVTREFTPLWDTTPPDEPTMTSWKPETNYGRMFVRFTTSAAGNDEYRVLRRTNGGSWVTVVDWTATGNSEAKVHESNTGTAGNTYSIRVDVRDDVGNTRTGTEYTYTLKAAAQTINATATNHYRESTWNKQGNLYAYQGYFSDPGTNYLGFFFYGATTLEDACDADSDLGGKLTVTGMTVRLIRVNAVGSFEVDVYVGTTTTTSATGVPTVSNATLVGDLQNQGVAETFNLPAGHVTALANGTARALGLSRNASSGYLACRPLSSDAASGQIVINSLG